MFIRWKVYIFIIATTVCSFNIKGEQSFCNPKYSHGLDLINLNRYDEAKDEFEAFLNEVSLTDTEKYYGYQALANCYFNLNDTITAQAINEFYYSKPIDYSQVALADSLFENAILAINANEINKAIQDLHNCISLQKKSLDDNHILIARSHDWLSYAYSLINEYDNAIIEKKKAIAIYRLYNEIDMDLFITTGMSLADLYDNVGRYQDAYNLLYECLSNVNCNDDSYFKIRNKISRYLSILGKYSEAIPFEEETITLASEKPRWLIQSYCNTSDYRKALGDIVGAFDDIEKALVYSETINDETEVAKILNIKATLYSIVGDQIKAIQEGKKALDIRERLYQFHSDIAMSYNNIARYYSFLGLFTEAIFYQNKCIEQYEKIGFAELPEMAFAYNNLSDYYKNQKKYDDAFTFQNKSIEILSKNYSKEHPDYAIALNNLALLYSLIGDFDSAIKYGLEVIELRRKIFKGDHTDVAVSFSNLAAYYLGKKDYNIALEYNNQALSMYEKLIGTDNADYIRTIEFAAEIYYSMHDFQSAIKILKPIEDFYREQYGENSPTYMDYAKEMAFLYHQVDDYELCLQYVSNVTQYLDNYTLSTFGCLTSNERTQFWERNKYWYYILLPYLTNSIRNDEIAAKMYNSLITSKGILLSTEIEMEDIIHKSGNDVLINKWAHLQEFKTLLSYKYSGFATDESIDSLLLTIQNLEKEILEEVHIYGDVFRKFKLSWHNIQEALDPEEIAVEFFTDEKKYLALVITSDCKSPIFVDLFKENEIYWPTKTRVAGDLNDYKEKIWDPILSQCEKSRISKIYFSPFARLYNTPIEYAMDGDSLLSDSISIYRLSSTREVIYLKNKTLPLKSAAIYGGLKYEKDEGVNYMCDDASQDVILRNDFDYLPGTLDEVTGINEFLDKSNVSTTLYTGYEGTEDTFYNINNSEINIIHLATHGFYYKDTFSNEWILRIMSQYPPQCFSEEDAALCRTGVILSNAKDGLSKASISNFNDGILTAKDISQLHLTDLTLTVLSACQTGQGDISEDGVLGLQRGFKKAGAQRMLLSLWNVNDEATNFFMQSFYRLLFEHQSCYEALHGAQMELRNYKNGKFDYSKYWAAFILLDSN